MAPTCTRTPSSPAARSSVGPPTPVATAAYCAELLEQAYGPAALLKPHAARFQGYPPDPGPADEITLRGRVVSREGRTHACEIWVHAQDGGLRGVATATVVP